jgi:hypothetical protein
VVVDSELYYLAILSLIVLPKFTLRFQFGLTALCVARPPNPNVKKNWSPWMEPIRMKPLFLLHPNLVYVAHRLEVCPNVLLTE